MCEGGPGEGRQRGRKHKRWLALITVERGSVELGGASHQAGGREDESGDGEDHGGGGEEDGRVVRNWAASGDKLVISTYTDRF
jgi:hypothetical protein